MPVDERQLKRFSSKKKLGTVVVALIVLLVMGVAYYYTEGTNNQVDNVIAAVTRAPLTEFQKEKLAGSLAVYAPRDNREDISVLLYTLPDPADKEALDALAVQLDQAQTNLFLLDSESRGALGPLLDLEPMGSHYPAARLEGAFYLLDGTVFASFPGLELPDGVGIALRSAHSYQATRDAQAREYYQYQSGILANIARAG